MKKINTLILLLALAFGAQSQIIINEFQPDADRVELKNIGASAVNVSSYQLCTWPDYAQIQNLTIISGQLTIQPGEFLVVDGHFSSVSNINDNELGLYINGSFSNPASMVDYVEWGSHGHQRSITAETAGIWSDGDFITSIPAGLSMAWNGVSDDSSSWISGENTFGSENFAAGCTTDGGTISTSDNETTVYTCPGDGVDDFFTFMNEGSDGESDYAYIITDADGIILGLPEGNEANFEGAGVGECQVWGLSYTGTVIAELGDNVNDVDLTDACFDLSENSITVLRGLQNGGTVSTTDGDTTISTCPGDDIDDIFTFMTEGNDEESSYAYIITDADGIILGLPEGNEANFDGAGVGECQVWGLSYTGIVTAEPGDNINEVDLTDGCYDLSENNITVLRGLQNGGTISTSDGETTLNTCAGDGIDDFFTFINEGSDLASDYTYIITDVDGNILGLPEENMANFEGAGGGECHAYGLSYTGEVTAEVGDNINEVTFTDECYDLSANFITVIRTFVDGASVSTDDGATSITIVVGDGNADVITFVNLSSAENSYSYIITDDTGVILGMTDDSNDFEGADPGTCHVYGVNYTGTLTATAGENVTTVSSDGCFDLSDDFVTIIREQFVSVDELSEEDNISVFPTEFENELIITGLVSSSDMIIYNATGQVVFNERIGSGTVTINLPGLSKGMYFGHITSNEANKSFRVIRK